MKRASRPTLSPRLSRQHLLQTFSIKILQTFSIKTIIKVQMRIVWLVNENHFERAMLLRNGSHLPHNAHVWILLHNGGRGREKN
jgi:hypothetical protein